MIRIVGDVKFMNGCDACKEDANDVLSVMYSAKNVSFFFAKSGLKGGVYRDGKYVDFHYVKLQCCESKGRLIFKSNDVLITNIEVTCNG